MCAYIPVPGTAIEHVQAYHTIVPRNGTRIPRTNCIRCPGTGVGVPGYNCTYRYPGIHTGDNCTFVRVSCTRTQVQLYQVDKYQATNYKHLLIN